MWPLNFIIDQIKNNFHFITAAPKRKLTLRNKFFFGWDYNGSDGGRKEKKNNKKKCEHDKWKKGGLSGNKNERVTWDTIFGGGNMILEKCKIHI